MRVQTFLTAAVALAVLAGAAVPLLAQAPSLADVARREEARRQTVTEPAKVYTNRDLHATAAPSAPAPETQRAPATATVEATGTEKDKGAATEKEITPVKDQGYWAGRMKQLQSQLDRDQTYAQAMQSRINALTADFAARDDPAQRGVISSDRQKAVAELDRLKLAIEADKKAIADLAEDARRAGVPPGWLR